jgi:AbrB family looped-hinge helix DNA binding protein
VAAGFVQGWCLKPDASMASTIRVAHTSCRVKLLESPPMDAVLISTKGQIVLPVAVRRALGLKPGMRVQVKVEGKRAMITPAPAGKPSCLAAVQAVLAYKGPAVSVDDMRVTNYKG